MSSIESSPPIQHRGDMLTRVMTILSGIGSFGSLLLSLSGATTGLGNSVVIFQGFAFGTVLIAGILYFELVRDKWPDRENRFLRIDLLAGLIDPNHVPEEAIRMDILTLETRERLALSENKKELAAKYREKIKYWEEILRKRE